MNFLHHRQKSRCQVLPMPDGLQELMSDISREVLRCQPTMDCTYKFIADYLEAQIKTREKSKLAMEVIDEAILKTDEAYEEFVKCNIPKDKSSSFLDLMEITFRRFVEQKRRLKEDPRYITFHADDMLEELIRKCDLTKVEILRSRPAIQWAYKKFVKTYIASIEGTLDTEDLYIDTEKLVISCSELQALHEAAVLIQKVFRGYRTRKSLAATSHPEEVSSLTSFELYIMGKDEDVKNAAIKIQAMYKGFITRKKLDTTSLRQHPVSELEWIEKFAQENADEINRAAVKIQARYKGFTVRKQLQLKVPTTLEKIEELVEEPTHPEEEPAEELPVVQETVAEEPPVEEAVEVPLQVEAPVEEPPPAVEVVEEPPVEEPPPAVEEPPPAVEPAEEPAPVEEPPPVEEPSQVEAPVEEPASAEAPVDEPPATEAPVEEPPAEEVPVEEPPQAEEPPAVEEPVEEPPLAAEPAEEPPQEEPPQVEESVPDPPPTEEVVTEDAPADASPPEDAEPPAE